MFLKIKCWLKTLCSQKVIEEFIENWLLILVGGWDIIHLTLDNWNTINKWGCTSGNRCFDRCLIENINLNVEYHMNYIKILTCFNII